MASSTPHVNAHSSAGAYTNAHALAAELRQAARRSTAKAASITRHHGMLLTTRVKAKASGRPGPRAITGDYRRSWSSVFARTPGGGTAVVGTNKPQARRLEFGFVGPDRIGRVFNQPPYPHAAPAADEQFPLYEADLAQALTLGGGPR